MKINNLIYRKLFNNSTENWLKIAVFGVKIRGKMGEN